MSKYIVESVNSVRMNEKFMSILEELSNIMLKQGEPFRSRAYQKAIETIISYPKDIVSVEQLKGQSGIGTTIIEKLTEFMNTGTLKLLEREKNNPVNILGEIYGIGPKKATELVSLGINNIEELKQKQNECLNDIQKIGLKYHFDIIKRIPRSEIQEYEIIFKETFKKVAILDSKFEIVGSYRRGAESSGDIDVIITSNSSKIFISFIDLLIKKQLITEVLSRGTTKCLVIAKIPNSDSYRRVDFLYATNEEYPFSVLYFTGSKYFNTVMRQHALTMNLTMNEHGLYNIVGGKKTTKVEYNFKTEKDIFDYLNLEYKTPIERIDGRAVIVKNSNSQSKKLFIIEEDTVDNVNANKSKINKTLKKKDNEIKNTSVKNKKQKFIIEDNSDSEETILNTVKTVKENETENIKQDTVVNNEINDKTHKILTEMVQSFRKNGISVLEKLTENSLNTILKEANKLYYNEQPIMTDNEYDIIKEFVTNKFENNVIIKEIGSAVERNKSKLPYEMPSMDKIKPDTNAINNWMNKFKGPYTVSCKLDGVSGLYSTENNISKLYTRGDGKYGQDISYLIPHLRLPKVNNITIRGEFIIPKNIFDIKYKTKFANARNMVAGIINHKTINETIKDVHFVAYELITPIMKPTEQLQYLESLNVETVNYKCYTEINNNLLSDSLIYLREKYLYEIDGLIISDDKIYERKSGNPEHSFAFKMILSDQSAEAKVVDVIWSPSKDGYLKPRVRIEPLYLDGVIIEYATGYNADFIYRNKIGIGCIVELIRSGGVIPKITKVNIASETPKMPNVPYKWNETNIDILLEEFESDEVVREKNITGFFKGLGVEGLSSGNITRLMNAGFDSIKKILEMELNDFMKVDGFQIKTSQKLYNGIKNKVSEVSLITIMACSNIFGRGFSEKKIELIMNAYPNILMSNENTETKIKQISSIKGMADKTSEAFVKNIDVFVDFMKEINLLHKITEFYKNSEVTEEINVLQNSSNNETNINKHPLFQKTIVMTGFRLKELENQIKNFGGNIGTSVSKNTNIVIIKDVNEDTVNVKKAKKLEIKIMLLKDFINTYII